MQKAVSWIAIMSVFMAACAHQTPAVAPGAAFIQNFKTAVALAALAIPVTRAALPSFKLDPDDLKAAGGILDDVGKARDVLEQKLAPYSSFDTSNADQIKQAAQDVLDTLQQLHDQRVDHVKNPEARKQIDDLLKAVKGVVNDIIKSKVPPPPPSAPAIN